MKPGLLKQIGRLFAFSWSYVAQYRGDVMLYTIVSSLATLISLAVWYTVASSGARISSTEILTYYVIIFLVQLIIRSWRGIFIVEKILDGKIVIYLIRPPIILLENITGNLVTKIYQLTGPLLLFFLAILLHPEWFSAQIFQPQNILLFALSVFLAFVIALGVDYSIGLLAFWLEDAFEIHGYRFLLTQISSGVLIPFALMPETLKVSFSFLPFRYMISAPAEILTGQTVGMTAGHLLGIQLMWAIALIILLRVEWTRGLKRYAIPGQ